MTIHLPDDLAGSIRAEILSGQFLSEDELVAAAVRDYLRRKQTQSAAKASTDASPAVGGELDPQELQRRLYEAGVLSEIKPPITDLTPYQNRQAVPLLGEPLSETVIRERR